MSNNEFLVFFFIFLQKYCSQKFDKTNRKNRQDQSNFNRRKLRDFGRHLFIFFPPNCFCGVEKNLTNYHVQFSKQISIYFLTLKITIIKHRIDHQLIIVNKRRCNKKIQRFRSLYYKKDFIISFFYQFKLYKQIS